MIQTVKNLPAVQETWVQPLGWEDSLEKGVAAHSIILAWRIPWTEEPGGLQSMGHEESDMMEHLSPAQHVQIHVKLNLFVVHQKLTQLCKSTIY